MERGKGGMVSPDTRSPLRLGDGREVWLRGRGGPGAGGQLVYLQSGFIFYITDLHQSSVYRYSDEVFSSENRLMELNGK